jgi:KaiC/GvpD/RAD55 family RecA-like ATPase
MEVLPPEKIEPLIFKLAMTDSRYASLMLEYFKKEWFEDNVLGDIADTVLVHIYGKKNKLPKLSTIELLTEKKYAKTLGQAAVAKVNNALNIDLNNYDMDFLDENIITYLKSSGLYTLITSSLDSIERTQKFEGLDEFEKITNMSFNDDLGFNYLEQIDEHIEKLTDPEAKISTSWPSLDECCNGGYNKDGRNLIIFMAEAGMGKSLMLSNTASSYLKDGKFIIIISLEMSELIYGKRIDAHLSKLDINELENNVDTLKQEVENIKGLSEDPLLVIKEFPPDSVNTAQIKNYIDGLVRKHKRKPDAILVDYVNLILPNDNTASGDNTYIRVGKVSKDLRALSYFFNCPVISATQINRSGYGNTEPGMENISDSMGIAHTADFIGALYQNEGDKEAGIINLKICKNRLGGLVGKSLEFTISYSNLLIQDEQSSEFTVADPSISKIFEDTQLGEL